MLKLSIVVPIYKVEKYLSKCINSIINQQYKNLEIILVDDGSPDNCGNICENFAKEDSRIKVIHKANGGVISAWKAGILASSGDYVGFVDSDDWIDENMYSTMIEKIGEDVPDIITVGFKEVNTNENDILKINVKQGFDGLYKKDDIKTKILPTFINGHSMKPNPYLFILRWNNLFKREQLLKTIHYSNEKIINGEDGIIMIAFVPNADSIFILSSFAPYNYRVNPVSFTKTYHANMWENMCMFCEVIKRIFIDSNNSEYLWQVDAEKVYLGASCINHYVKNGRKYREVYDKIKSIVNDEELRNGLKYLNTDLSIADKILILMFKLKFKLLIYLCLKIIIKAKNRGRK